MFWGKINDDRTKYLSICEHGLAVAHVFYMLVQLPSIRRSLDVSANVNLSDVQLQRLATFALLHDFGKANYGFQRKPFNSQYIGVSHTREVYPLLDILVNDFANAIEYTVLASWFSNEADFESYLLAMLSHHGYLLRRDDLDHNTPSKWWGKNEINEIRNLLSLSKIAFPNAFESDVPFIPDSSELEHRFLGLLELADWLASDERIFSIDHPYGYPYQLDDIAIKAKAANLLQQVGLTPEKFQTELRKHGWTFETLFEFAPRPIQRLIETLRTDDPNNRLAILEDETGEVLNEKEIRAGYQTFKAQKAAADLANIANKHGLQAMVLQAFVDAIMGRMIFDGEQLTDLLAPLQLNWKARREAELALMEDLVPYLQKLAGGREISGLNAYE